MEVLIPNSPLLTDHGRIKDFANHGSGSLATLTVCHHLQRSIIQWFILLVFLQNGTESIFGKLITSSSGNFDDTGKAVSSAKLGLQFRVFSHNLSKEVLDGFGCHGFWPHLPKLLTGRQLDLGNLITSLESYALLLVLVDSCILVLCCKPNIDVYHMFSDNFINANL
uniref:Uncharacterized protein n=1 Tax=Cyanothece sp. (strain PCC 7425 / ATCC 29141) TaxID=395961 RepID=B8HRE1_CYAP4